MRSVTEWRLNFLVVFSMTVLLAAVIAGVKCVRSSVLCRILGIRGRRKQDKVRMCIRRSSEERWHFRETPCVVVTLHLGRIWVRVIQMVLSADR